MTKYANQKRLPASTFKVEDIIILDGRNIKIIRLNKLLDYKNLEPFRVSRAINNMVYKLKLPNNINVFSIFYFWLLHLNNSDPLLRQTYLLPLLIYIDKEGSNHYVNEVINSRINERRIDPLTNKKDYLIYKFK